MKKGICLTAIAVLLSGCASAGDPRQAVRNFTSVFKGVQPVVEWDFRRVTVGKRTPYHEEVDPRYR